MRVRLAFIVCLLLALPMGAKSPGFCESQKSEWLMLVYMAADNTLSSAAEQDLREMMSVGSDEVINILVLLDKNGVGDSALYSVKKGMLEPINDDGMVIPQSKEVNMGSPETLRNFLSFASRYERNHTFLVLWDHGSGWKGFCTDSQSKDALSLSEITQALSGFKIDVLGIDACEGALMEVVYALRNSADYFVGSQKDEPESGWNYTTLLSMAKSKSHSPEEFAITCVEAFEKHYKASSFLSVSLALSAINLSKVEKLAKSLDAFSNELITSCSLLHFEISEARNSTEFYEGDNKGDVDLGDFAKKCLNTTSYLPARMKAKELLEALANTVLYSTAISAFFPTTNVRADNATGLSIYFPTSNFNPEYLSTHFAQSTNWSKFLKTFLSPPHVEERSIRLNISYENNTIKVENEDESMKPLIYICDSLQVVASGQGSVNYRLKLADYYQIFAYNYTLQNGILFLDGIFKGEKKWIGYERPNVRIRDVEFLREDGVEIFKSGKHAIENRSFLAKVQIENTGNVKMDIDFLLTCGDFYFRENISLATNSTLIKFFNISLPPGTFKFRIALDAENLVRETDEEDNFFELEVFVKDRIPSKGVRLILKSKTLCEYRIYNESGVLLAHGKLVDKETVYISQSDFLEGEHLYLHFFSDSRSSFKKIQIFSEDEVYEVIIPLEASGASVIDYAFIIAVIALCSLFALAFVFWLIKRNVGGGI